MCPSPMTHAPPMSARCGSRWGLTSTPPPHTGTIQQWPWLLEEQNTLHILAVVLSILLSVWARLHLSSNKFSTRASACWSVYACVWLCCSGCDMLWSQQCMTSLLLGPWQAHPARLLSNGICGCKVMTACGPDWHSACGELNASAQKPDGCTCWHSCSGDAFWYNAADLRHHHGDFPLAWHVCRDFIRPAVLKTAGVMIHPIKFSKLAAQQNAAPGRQPGKRAAHTNNGSKAKRSKMTRA